MRSEIIKLSVVVLIICAACAGCSRSRTNSAQREEDADDSQHWAPTAEALESARREKESPLIVVPTIQPRASEYDLNPRAAMPTEDSSEETVESDPALGGLEKLPPSPALPKFASGDEADQFGLPEWERMARGELHVKRIRY